MAKRIRDDLTRDLFEAPRAPTPAPGSLSYGIEVRYAVSSALKATALSRFEVAARMSELTGNEISKYMLDAFAAESREAWRFPFEYCAAFEVATGSWALTQLHERKRGCRLYVGQDALRAELGHLELQEAEIRRRKNALKTHLSGVK